MRCKALAYSALFVILAALSSTASFSLSVSPAAKYIFFSEDMAEVEGTFTIHDGLDESNIIDISVSEEYRDVVWLEKTRLSFRPDDTRATVDFRIDLDPEAFPPGEHEVRFSFLQSPLERAPGITARLSVAAKMIIVVPYPDYFVDFKASKGTGNVNLLMLNRGKQLTGCSVSLFSDRVMVGKSGEFSLVSQETVVFGFSKPPSEYNLLFRLECNERSFNHSHRVKIERFPYNTSASVVDFDPEQGSVAVSLVLENPAQATLAHQEIFYDLFVSGKKIKSGSFFVAPLSLGAFDSVTLQAEGIPAGEEMPELKILLKAVIDNEVVSLEQKAVLIPPERPSYSINFRFLFLFAFLLIAGFVVIKIRKVYKREASGKE